MSDMYRDKNRNPIQVGDIRINSCGNNFLITKDNYREISVLYMNLEAETDRACCFDNTVLIRHYDNIREALLNFINDYVEISPKPEEKFFEGFDISIDVSTGDYDAENRVFGKIIEIQGNTLLCEMSSNNFNLEKLEKQNTLLKAENTQLKDDLKSICSRSDKRICKSKAIRSKK